MTAEELQATAAAIKEAKAVAEAFKAERDAALTGKPTADRVKAAAAALVANGTLGAGYLDQAEKTLASHESTLDFLLNLAEDRLKAAAAARDWPEVNPGGAVPPAKRATASGSYKEAEQAGWEADMAKIATMRAAFN